MPEGDTLYRIAEKLRPALAGQTIAEASSRKPRTGPGVDAASLVGRRVDAVDARGKHLLITFDDQRVIHTHLGMTGAWHLYALGKPWAKPARQAGLVIATTQHAAVCFSPKLLALTTAALIRGNNHLRRLGPDLMRAETTAAQILPRLRTQEIAPIGEAVMNQTVMAGVGNVYKSETLFLAEINPWTRVGQLTDAQLTAYLELTHQLMRQNRRGGMRTTRFRGPGARLWVYGRQREPCLQCGAVVRMRRQGDSGRSTYWCPACQPPAPQECVV